MKPNESKLKFVQLRAEGRSFNYIAQCLHISQTTCVKWERELANQIDDSKRACFAELLQSFGMAKEARIKRLGEALKRIDEALEAIDFTNIDPAKLLELKLKYMEALKAEYVGGDFCRLVNVDSKSILEAFADLLNRTKAGEVATEQGRGEAAILSRLLKAYELTETEGRLDEIEARLEAIGENEKDR